MELLLVLSQAMFSAKEPYNKLIQVGHLEDLSSKWDQS